VASPGVVAWIVQVLPVTGVIVALVVPDVVVDAPIVQTDVVVDDSVTALPLSGVALMSPVLPYIRAGALHVIVSGTEGTASAAPAPGPTISRPQPSNTAESAAPTRTSRRPPLRAGRREEYVRIDCSDGPFGYLSATRESSAFDRVVLRASAKLARMRSVIPS
jgi:hypothetical protein